MDPSGGQTQRSLRYRGLGSRGRRSLLGRGRHGLGGRGRLSFLCAVSVELSNELL